MDKLFKFYAAVLLALHLLIDVALGAVTYYQSENLSGGLAFVILGWVLGLFLLIGIRNEEFMGRYGHRVCLNREPFAYWFVAALLALCHSACTVLTASFIRLSNCI